MRVCENVWAWSVGRAWMCKRVCELVCVFKNVHGKVGGRLWICVHVCECMCKVCEYKWECVNVPNCVYVSTHECMWVHQLCAKAWVYVCVNFVCMRVCVSGEFCVWESEYMCERESMNVNYVRVWVHVLVSVGTQEQSFSDLCSVGKCRVLMI